MAYVSELADSDYPFNPLAPAPPPTLAQLTRMLPMELRLEWAVRLCAEREDDG